MHVYCFEWVREKFTRKVQGLLHFKNFRRYYKNSIFQEADCIAYPVDSFFDIIYLIFASEPLHFKKSFKHNERSRNQTTTCSSFVSRDDKQMS